MRLDCRLSLSRCCRNAAGRILGPIALWLLAFVGLASLSHEASACVVAKQLDLGSLADADVVLRAKIVSYEAVFHPKDYTGRRELKESSVNIGEPQFAEGIPDRLIIGARMKFEVTETILGGPKVQSWEATWRYGGRMAEQWSGPENVIVGLSARIGADGTPYIAVVEFPCASQGIFEDTPENATAILSAVSKRRNTIAEAIKDEPRK